MLEEATSIITTIRQMEVSLDDSKARTSHPSDDDDLKVTYPLSRCLVGLKEKHQQMSKLHRERYEQVNSKKHDPMSRPCHVPRTYTEYFL